MLIEFIHLAADFFMVFWSVTVLFIFILLGIKWVFVDRKFDESPDDVPERTEGVHFDAEAIERKNNVEGDE